MRSVRSITENLIGKAGKQVEGSPWRESGEFATTKSTKVTKRLARESREMENQREFRKQPRMNTDETQIPGLTGDRWRRPDFDLFSDVIDEERRAVARNNLQLRPARKCCTAVLEPGIDRRGKCNFGTYRRGFPAATRIANRVAKKCFIGSSSRSSSRFSKPFSNVFAARHSKRRQQHAAWNPSHK